VFTFRQSSQKMPNTAPATNHAWKFVRTGGMDHVSLESGADLLALGSLDPKLWVALSCPVKGLELDEKTLALVDTDGDGRIRVPEVLAAVRWAGARLKDAGELLKGAPGLPLDSIDGASPEGRALLETARKVLAQLGKGTSPDIGPDDTVDPSRAIGAAGLAGDGIVPPEAASDAGTRGLITDIMACVGGTAGAKGMAGVTLESAASFFAEAEACAAAHDAAPTFLPYAGWTPPESSSPVQKLGFARVREILAGPGRADLAALFARDLELASEFKAVSELDRLVRYHRDLRALLRNFVNFADFYSAGHRSVFQSGVLYLDGRSCELCVRVEDPPAHAALAAMSNAYIAYLDCRRTGGETLKIAACFTQGDSDYLFVGRNGVFFDRQNRDWDATITRIVDNPISIRQAFFAPYKKVIRFIGGLIAKRAAEADAATAPTAGAPIPPPRHKFDVGTVAALGVGVGGISAAFGSILGAFFGLGIWMPVGLLGGLLGVMVAISGPSVIIAWLKLRQRSLSPLLEASGWAVNSRVKINIPLGESLTDRAALPPRARLHLKDPYKDKAAARARLAFLAFIVLLASALLAARIHHKWPFEPKPAPEAAAPARK
jgi:hypothetical protein